MPKCGDIEPLVTPYLDGEASSSEHEIVETHLNMCPPCRARANAEAAARRVLRARATTLRGAVRASQMLRARCARAAGSRSRMARVRARAMPLSMAAALVLAVAGVFVYGVTAQSTKALAAQLTLDHLKCFAFAPNPAGIASPHEVEAQLEPSYGPTRVPAGSATGRLRLLGARRCLYGEGVAAHIMYEHHGTPVSLFLLPNLVRESRELEVLGHHMFMWSRGQRTYVLIAREPPAEVSRLAAYVRTTME